MNYFQLPFPPSKLSHIPLCTLSSFINCCYIMCVCVCVCVCVCTCVHVCLIYSLVTGSLTECRARMIVRKPQAPCLGHYSIGTVGTQLCLGFHLGTGDYSAGFHAGTASTSTHGTISSALIPLYCSF
jgi:hypothetical protein